MKLEEALKDIDKYAELEDGWTSSNPDYVSNGKQISDITINTTKRFVKLFSESKDLDDVEIYPRGYDGISFVWEDDESYIELTISQGTYSWFKEFKVNDSFILSSDFKLITSNTYDSMKSDLVRKIKESKPIQDNEFLKKASDFWISIGPLSCCTCIMTCTDINTVSLKWMRNDKKLEIRYTSDGDVFADLNGKTIDINSIDSEFIYKNICEISFEEANKDFMENLKRPEVLDVYKRLADK